MASSSSCSSNISINSSLVDGDVLWMQDKHISQHIWNDEEDRKLHIRRVIPTYQGQEEIPEEIIPLLRQSDGIFKNKCGINHCLDRKMEAENTYFSHEMRIVYYYSSRCLYFIRSPCRWTDLCEELLGVRPEESELQGSMIKLSWLTHNFPDLNNHDSRFTRAWILQFIRGVLFVDKSSNKVLVRYLQFLRDFRECITYSWGSAVLGYLYREMYNATNYKTKSIGGMCILIHVNFNKIFIYH
ncbi:Serine/threonine-protein phosphatase 7 long form [Glycine max]|nr:Serine/threonine-protein phosphatase 7 long form [Glycine max]